MKNRINNYFQSISWPFLAFLIGVTSIKLQIKIVLIALYIVFVYIKKISLKNTFEGPVKFYLLMPIIGGIGSLLHGAFAIDGYWFGYAIGTIMWLMCGASFILINITIKNFENTKIENTIIAFFLLNAMWCLVELLKMMLVSRHWFPYWYTELDFIYGVSTGDHMHGIFQDNSTINAAICLLSVFYFVLIKRFALALTNLTICILCTSNLTVFILLAALGLSFLLFKSQRKRIFVLSAFCVSLYLFISPSNIKYVERVFAKIEKQSTNDDATSRSDKNLLISAPTGKIASNDTQNLTTNSFESIAENKPKSGIIKTNISRNKPFPGDQILRDFSGPVYANLGNTSLYYNEHVPEDLIALRLIMKKWYGIPYDSMPLAISPKIGKIVYLKNAVTFLRSGTVPFLFGAGTGNYSSKLALKMTGFKLQGSYPDRFAYINQTYFENTFYTHMFYWAKSIPDRSIINYPGSVYIQIAGEYGILGIFTFIVFYLYYFFRKAILQKQKLIFLFTILLLFFFDYWFELMNLTIFFELFMMSNMNKHFKQINES